MSIEHECMDQCGSVFLVGATLNPPSSQIKHSRFHIVYIFNIQGYSKRCLIIICRTPLSFASSSYLVFNIFFRELFLWTQNVRFTKQAMRAWNKLLCCNCMQWNQTIVDSHHFLIHCSGGLLFCCYFHAAKMRSLSQHCSAWIYAPRRVNFDSNQNP